MSLLEITDLSVSFRRDGALLTPVRGVSLRVEAGERVALVGESGCGKSLTALSVTRLSPTDRAHLSGGIVFDGTRLDSERAIRRIRRGGIAYVFQDPSASLNPVMRVEDQIAEVTSRSEIPGLLESVGLPVRAAKAYPCELSGGQQQRVMLAMAAGARPKLLIADEPTTALDVTMQRQVLQLIRSLAERMGMAVLLITHNLGIVARDLQRMYVMYAGQVVEEGFVRDVLSHPRHPYTEGLLAAVPSLEMPVDAVLRDIPGMVPPPDKFPAGCGFAPRCPKAIPACSLQMPGLTDGVRCSLCS